jgi:excisionase family DNA binding protein
MPEKLITVKEAADFLGIPRIKIRELVEKGELPAYRIGGKFIRFRKDQVEAIQSEILRRVRNNHLQQAPTQAQAAPAREYPRHVQDVAYSQSFAERALDFLYFNDFYIIAAVLAFLLLFYIFS